MSKHAYITQLLALAHRIRPARPSAPALLVMQHTALSARSALHDHRHTLWMMPGMAGAYSLLSRPRPLVAVSAE